MRVGIIGASSQVGSSIALYLRYFEKADVVSFIRGSYSSVIFDLFNIDHERIDFANTIQLREQLRGLDVVVDCSYPSGQLYSILPTIKKNLKTIIPSMQQNQVFIYMSSIMAYGMPADQSRISQYNIPRTSYAYIKRNAESEVRKLAKQYGVRAFNFRLGQVHGFLQSVNSSFREKLAARSRAYVNGSQNDLTNTVFINSICEAIIQCGKGELQPGLYTLVSQPQWTLGELYTYYQVNYGIESKLEYFKHSKPPSSVESLKAGGMALLKKYRPFLETYLLMKSPKLSIEFKGRYRQTELLGTVHNSLAKESIDFHLLGIPSLTTIRNINSSVSAVTTCEQQIEAWYNKIIEQNRK